MMLKFKEGEHTISDDSIEAKKILQGFDYYFINNKVVVTLEKKHYDIDDFEKKITQGNANDKEIKEFLKQLVKFYKKIKYNIEI